MALWRPRPALVGLHAAWGTLTRGGIGTTLPSVSYLERDELKKLGEGAIRRVIGDAFERLEADAGPDFEGKGACHFTVTFHTEADWRRASELQAEMTRAIIDDLDAKEDGHFPFVRIRSDGTWTFARHAAAE